MKKNWAGVRRKHELISLKRALSDFLASHDGAFRLQLNALWLNWDIILGEELAGLGYPLSYKNRVLIIGAEDSMALQDLSLNSAEIMDRANAFMNSDFFDKVRVVLMQGKRALNEQRRPLRPSAPSPLKRPPCLGNLIGRLPEDFPLKECYEIYCRLFEQPE